jgi:inorganic triphosphatase YgiF
MNTTSVNSIESELTLLVSCDDPDEMLSKIGNIDSVDNYIFAPADSLMIRDYYFDTPAGELSENRNVLRMRRQSEQVRITFKGPSRESKNGILERTEIEVPWSREALAELSGVPETRKLFISLFQEINAQPDALETFINAGLIIVQERETKRIIKRIRRLKTKHIVAELALDRVIYRVDDRALRHAEIEIEAKREESAPVVQRIAEYLVGLYPDELRKWAHTKFATGRAIQALLSKDSFENTLATDLLTNASYALIEEYLTADER